MRTPVVSAIGHEPDSPLLDLVADVRASTPTDAAKLVVPDVAEEARSVTLARDRIRAAVTGLARPRAGRARRSSAPAPCWPTRARWSTPVPTRSPCSVTAPGARLRHGLDRAADDLGHQRARARALSPLATLRRGYAVLQDADGHVIDSVAGVTAGADVSVRVADGRIHATTTSTEPDGEADD